ncbi:MAG: histidinol dehydrogenase [Cyanobacteria bacterium REEB67]|nr:histidinol dehydrogenase [Cyanobacteria bacterium REEB67]
MSDVEIKQTRGSMPIYAGSAADHWIKTNLGRKTVTHVAADGQSRGEKISGAVADIIATIQKDGDSGLAAVAARLGDKAPRLVILDPETLWTLETRIPAETREVLSAAADNIKKFAQGIVGAVSAVQVDFPEYAAGFELRPVKRAACYIPGGRYPLPSTALMTAMTARVAGVLNVCILSPNLCDEVLYAGSLAGVSEFYELGGAQAVAALALGTESIEPADMIVGPGNAYVTEAKRQLFGRVGIDMLAGPSEVAIIADDGANAKWIALDLLAQAEHDPDSRVYLLTDSASLAQQVAAELPVLAAAIGQLPDYIAPVLEASAILVLPDLGECARVSDLIAPEHLELQVAFPDQLKKLVTSYGALFMGYVATVPFGDYMAGPNHTLPTNRSARFAGGLSPLTFMRGQTWLDVRTGASDLPAKTAAFAGIEGLLAHRAAAQARLEE